MLKSFFIITMGETKGKFKACQSNRGKFWCFFSPSQTYEKTENPTADTIPKKPP
ncbi:MAG: hypothetical protein CM1200mP13_05760 [Candidatus Pelagibacterales bacterium]|nr:MAG: hypothetical protein CM1200mP13_05760 [Pelagibacterales bacterium]